MQPDCGPKQSCTCADAPGVQGSVCCSKIYNDLPLYISRYLSGNDNQVMLVCFVPLCGSICSILLLVDQLHVITLVQYTIKSSTPSGRATHLALLDSQHLLTC